MSFVHAYRIHIRSKDCTQLTTGFNTNMKIDLKSIIRKTDPSDDFHVSLQSASIPVNWYNFSSNLNNVTLYVDSVASLVVTPSNYDIFELVAYITAHSAFPFSASYNEQTNKVTLTDTSATAHTINFASTLNGSMFGRAIGFSATNLSVLSGGSVTSDGGVNLQVIHGLYLHSSFATSNVITTESGNITNIIDFIPVNKAPLEIIHFEPTQTGDFSSVVQQPEITCFTLAIRDQNGVLVDTNLSNFEIALLVEVHNKEVKSHASNTAFDYTQGQAETRRLEQMQIDFDNRNDAFVKSYF